MLAYVLIALKTCDENKVLDSLKQLSEVEEAHVLFGEWDIIAKVNVNGTEDLAAFMIEKVRTLPEVKLSSTMIVAKS
ncbi:Lrp/AsnC ligand binding domain-containing protein [Candidatus Woesearchaeota archaeon]|nr:Lrp/AsnC ligand binding domain-containing protein [Candidatus Woesearchaeota archaeon]